MEDLISIGTIADESDRNLQGRYGSRLATYAARCIDNELLMYFRAKKKVSREVSLYERSVWIKRETRSICLIL